MIILNVENIYQDLRAPRGRLLSRRTLQDFGLTADILQAGEQLEGTGIVLMKMGEENVPSIDEFIEAEDPGSTIGFDGRVIDEKLGTALENKFTVIHDIDLVGDMWAGRPEIEPSEIYELDLTVTGEDHDSKLYKLRSEMRDADYILVSKLEEIAWLYNLRGSDIDYTPVFYSFALISKENELLYVKDKCFSSSWGNVEVKPYEEIFTDLKSLKNCKIMLDKNSVSYALFKSFDSSVEKVMCKSPLEQMKAVKNSAEISATKAAHMKDGAAMVKFLYWLKSNIGKTEITEISAADYLENAEGSRAHTTLASQLLRDTKNTEL